MLKRVVIPEYGPFVFGRINSGVQPLSVPKLDALPIKRAGAPLDHNAIRLAAKSLFPVYGAEEDDLGNSRYGDCTAAGMLHAAAILQAIKGGPWRRPNRADALLLYAQVTNPHFVLATGANDNGADLVTVINHVGNQGAYLDGSFKIRGARAVDATNADAVKAALDQFHILYMGAGLPQAWIPRGAVSKVWDVAGPMVPTNGHCTIAYDYNDQGVQIDTWGHFVTVTWAALAAYWGDEAGGELYTFEAE